MADAADKRPEDEDQRRDALMLQLLKTPPVPRAQLKEQLKRAREEKRLAAKPKPSPGGVEPRPA